MPSWLINFAPYFIPPKPVGWISNTENGRMAVPVNTVDAGGSTIDFNIQTTSGDTIDYAGFVSNGGSHSFIEDTNAYLHYEYTCEE